MLDRYFFVPTAQKDCTVETTGGQCRLTRDGPSYRMSGPSGEHVLLTSGTSPDRLRAHWEGFVQTNGRIMDENSRTTIGVGTQAWLKTAFGPWERDAVVYVAHLSATETGDYVRWNAVCTRHGVADTVPVELLHRLKRPGDLCTVRANQGVRNAMVLALNPETGAAILEYEMPRGSTALIIRYLAGDERSVSYGALPARWRRLLAEPEAVPWAGRSQTRGTSYPPSRRSSVDDRRKDAALLAGKTVYEGEKGYWVGAPWPSPSSSSSPTMAGETALF